MMKKILKIGLLGLSLILLTSAYFMLDYVSLSSDASIRSSGKTSDALHIKINQKVYEGLQSYYGHYYPSEYAVCLYGDVKGYDVVITDFYEPFILKANPEKVEFLPCRSNYNGWHYLGISHSHPDNLWCTLSDGDREVGEFIMGLECSKTKIIFYSSIDGYTNGYYAQEN